MMLLRKQQQPSSTTSVSSHGGGSARSTSAAANHLHVGDVSPRAVRALGDEVNALYAKSASGDALSADERRACLALQAAGLSGGTAGNGQTVRPLSLADRYFLPAAYSGAVVAAYAASFFHPVAMIVGFPVLLVMIALLCVYLLPGGQVPEAPAAVTAKMLAPGVVLRRVFPPDVLKAVSPLVARNRTEALYYDSLQLLSDAATPLDASSRRDVLRQVNTLLENRSDLDRHRAQIGKLVDEGAVAVLEFELRELQRRQNEAALPGDAATVDSLRESVALCAQRLESARSLRALHGRLDAQTEVIHQALASIHFSLVRLRAAPAALSAPNLHEIRQTVARIESQTRAIEQAADEVHLLRGGGAGGLA